MKAWYEAYAGRPWLVALAGIVVGLALLFVGVALGGGSREHIVPVGTLIAAVVGGGIALGQLQVARKRHEEQTRADLQRRITESFTKAVEQLGSDKLAIRLGGVYTLERISKESSDDYWTVMETLTGFVREHARWKESEGAAASHTVARFYQGDDQSDQADHGPRTDVAAVLAVIMRRSRENREREVREKLRLSLMGTDLRGATLRGAHLERAVLRGVHLGRADLAGAHLERAGLAGAHFDRAVLTDAHLEGAFLRGAHLEGAVLDGAHLEGAVLIEAHLEGAVLIKAHLEGAVLIKAKFEGAILSGAHLERAGLTHTEGLTQEQLDSAFGDTATVLPEGLTRPAHWPPAQEERKAGG